MSLATTAKFGGLFVAAKEMVPICQTLIEMVWPQPPMPIQMDNSTASVVVKNTIVPQKINSMDLQFHWLRCHMLQGQFHFYWSPGNLNWGDYSTEHHPLAYHKINRPLFAGAAF